MPSHPRKYLFLAATCLALCACNGGGGAASYDQHASETMQRLAEAQPLYTAPPPPAPEPVDSGLEEWLAENLTQAAAGEEAPMTAPETRGPGWSGGAHPPDFMRPPPEPESPRVEVDLSLQQGQALTPGGMATVRFTITPKVNAAAIRVHYLTEGAGKVTPEESMAGAGAAGRSLLATAQLLLEEGYTELRATATGQDATGAQLFQATASHFFIVKPDRVLAGDNGFQSLEVRELERQRDSGEISREDFQQRMNLLHPR